jgi:hypothetical protein
LFSFEEISLIDFENFADCFSIGLGEVRLIALVELTKTLAECSHRPTGVSTAVRILDSLRELSVALDAYLVA